MKNVALITGNKVLSQGLEAALRARGDLEMQLLPPLGYRKAQVGVEAYGAQVAVIDAIERSDESEVLALCRSLRSTAAGCKILLLVSADTLQARDFAVRAKQQGLADDFVFYDSSLTYLFAKLSAF